MSRKKPPRKKKGKKRGLIWVPIFLLLFTSMVATFYLIFLRPGTLNKPAPPEKQQSHSSLIFEEPTSPGYHSLAPGPIKKRPSSHDEAKIAIVIDDMGYKKNIGRQLLDLDLPLSFAFLPFGPYTSTQAELAHRKNRDILVHMPMEPQDKKWDAGPGALLTSMGTDEIGRKFSANLSAVPYATGINNHMGSLFTENLSAMRTCLVIAKNKNLFFLDSLTSTKSKGYDVALDLGIKTERRDIFLDNSLKPDDIKRQLDALISLAQKRGSAIAIGHPHKETLEALREKQNILKNKVKFVKVSELLE